MKTASLAPKRAPYTESAKTKHSDRLPAIASSQRSAFVGLALNMSWQLAIVVLVPILAGVKLDKVFSTSSVCTFVGLGLALVGSIAVMWRAMQTANRLPVPKLTAAEKRAIKKSYEDEDKNE